MSGSRKRHIALMTALLASTMLAGCGGVRDTLGLNKSAPDEFAVVSRAPLSVPPDSSLRPPRAGDRIAPDRVSTPEKARQAVFGIPGGEQQRNLPGGSAGEQALLRRAGAERSDPNIRAEVNEETSAIIEGDKRLVDKLLFWKDEKPKGETVNPGEESERLQRRQALGLPDEKNEIESDIPEPQEEEGLFDNLF